MKGCRCVFLWQGVKGCGCWGAERVWVGVCLLRGWEGVGECLFVEGLEPCVWKKMVVWMLCWDRTLAYSLQINSEHVSASAFNHIITAMIYIWNSRWLGGRFPIRSEVSHQMASFHISFVILITILSRVGWLALWFIGKYWRERTQFISLLCAGVLHPPITFQLTWLLFPVCVWRLDTDHTQFCGAIFSVRLQQVFWILIEWHLMFWVIHVKWLTHRR